MKIQFTFLSILLSISFLANAQFGKLPGKVNLKKEDKPKEAITSSPAKIEKDADGYNINDPEVKALFEGKNVYNCTDFALFGSILNTPNSFKMAGVAVELSDDNMNIMPVGKKQYGGIYKATVNLKKGATGLFTNESTSQPLYASLEKDGSILIFNGRKAELLSKDEKLITMQNQEALENKGAERFLLVKEAKALENEVKKLRENETFYKTGDVKSVKKDPAMETQFLKVLNDANKLPTVAETERASYKKVMLIFTDWTIEKNALDQPIKMVYAAWAEGSYVSSKKCFFQKVYFKKDYQGGGTYSPVKFDEAQSPSVIGCELMK